MPVQELLKEIAGLIPESSALPTSKQRTKIKDAAATAQSDKAQKPLKQLWQSSNLSNAVTSEIQPAENQPSSQDTPLAVYSSHNDTQAQDEPRSFGTSHETDSSSWTANADSGLKGKAYALLNGKVSPYQEEHALSACPFTPDFIGLFTCLLLTSL